MSSIYEMRIFFLENTLFTPLIYSCPLIILIFALKLRNAGIIILISAIYEFVTGLQKINSARVTFDRLRSPLSFSEEQGAAIIVRKSV
ncbi:MAG: hypothetical protein B6245_23215 [Desulfobacteraceae bacterium 4572_88]|nr:MAG: hypothetical protein B6245_23215 [Desulfobacteraceae bacterium 4572_88]